MQTTNLRKLNLPNFEFRLRSLNGRNEIFDAVRKKWLVCTPEEWVRQHFISWLIVEKRFPASNIAIEGGLKLNTLQKRTDIVAFYNGNPLLLVECKAPEVKISQKTFDQLFRYNSEVKAPYISVTNGLAHIFAHFDVATNAFTFLETLPNYPL
jgi:type I site-specific restriction-modification system R (restriction) subunit